MKSMTGYGAASSQVRDLTISIELTSVNRRTLEVTASCPRDWQMAERLILEHLGHTLKRGKVSAYVKVDKTANESGIAWEKEAVINTLQDVSAFAREMGIPFEPDANALLRLVLATKKNLDLPAFGEVEKDFLQILAQATFKLDTMRIAEGLALTQDIRQRIQYLSQLVTQITNACVGTVAYYREQLLKRLTNAGLTLDLNDERVLKEIALFADRSDITEEITRLNSHLEQFLQFLSDKDPVGRKMDFMCQEIFRELNTIGSKGNALKVVQLVIEAKNELERIREQIQNIE